MADSFLSRADGYVQKFDEILLAETTKKSNSAVADAVALTNRFGGLHDFVVAQEGQLDNESAAFRQYANDEIKRTEAVIAELNSNREKLDKSRTDAVTAANEAKVALAAVNAARLPRNLTPEQIKAIASKMSAWTRIPGSAQAQEAAVFPTNGTWESGRLVELITKALGNPSGAGWNVSGYSPRLRPPMFAFPGVGILASSSPRAQNIATALVEALNSEGIHAFVFPDKWGECEGQHIDQPDTKPWCSRITVEVGEHP